MTHETDAIVERIMSIRNGMILDADAEALIRDALDVRGGIPSEEEIDASGAPHSGIRRFSPETGTEFAKDCDLLTYLNGKAIRPDGRVCLDISFDELKQLRAALTVGHAPTLAVPSREALISVTVSLAAAISLLERTPKAKMAAPSNTMFAQMLDDYRRSLKKGRATLADTSTDREVK